MIEGGTLDSVGKKETCNLLFVSHFLRENSDLCAKLIHAKTTNKTSLERFHVLRSIAAMRDMTDRG